MTHILKDINIKTFKVKMFYRNITNTNETDCEYININKNV